METQQALTRPESEARQAAASRSQPPSAALHANLDAAVDQPPLPSSGAGRHESGEPDQANCRRQPVRHDS